MKNQQLSPSDIHLLLNLIGSSQSFKSAQSHWLPICLPKFDANGFLYASVTYLNDTTCMVLLTVDSEKFYPLKSITEKVFTVSFLMYVKLSIRVICYMVQSWRSPILVRNGRPVLPGFQRWSNINRFMISIKRMFYQFTYML
ncbi:unnamed protein product [Schistosoma mattheei]|uniref:Vacuolar fusion protein MON1 homolog n=1 Tax=Schistosoma mattheei TaxID=31246 RepID=A0A183Q0Q2_9TREM|nr:unnamed protein product [Schistosoma mattheei]